MRTEEIIQDLRRRIIGGEFAVGGTLPRRHLLLEHYDASNMTVQRAINQLAEEGFLVSRGSKGIFLSATPPNRFRYALVVQPSEVRMEIKDDTLWSAVENAVELYHEKHPEYSFSYYTIRESGAHQPEYLRLKEDLKNGLLAGAIIPRSLDDELLEGLRPHPIAVYTRLEEHVHGIRFFHDWISMTNLALEQLKQHHARKAALIMIATTDQRVIESIEKTVLASDLQSCPEWIQGVFQLSSQHSWGGRLIALLYKQGMPDVPDGLIVLNENLLPSILAELKRLGLKPGKDVHVVSHCNIPAIHAFQKNVDYVAFNQETLLSRSIEALEAVRCGKPVQKNNPVEPELIIQNKKQHARRKKHEPESPATWTETEVSHYGNSGKHSSF